jgi:hypothetical protein
MGLVIPSERSEPRDLAPSVSLPLPFSEGNPMNVAEELSNKHLGNPDRNIFVKGSLIK